MVGNVSGPAAEGARIEWQELPGPVQAAIEGVCGAGVVQARTQPGGFSPGLAARVRCANGARYFVKAVSAQANPDTPWLHRQEGRVLAALEPVISSRQLPIPRLHRIVDTRRGWRWCCRTWPGASHNCPGRPPNSSKWWPPWTSWLTP